MSRYRLLFLPPLSSTLTRQVFPQEALARIGELTDAEFNTSDTQLTTAELAEKIRGFDICVTGWGSPRITPEVLDNADRLRLILHSAGTVKPYLCPEVFRRGITVTSSNGAMSRVTAEAALALMIIGNWNAKDWLAVMESGGWKTKESVVPGIQGKTIGIIGYGAVTRALLPFLAPFHDLKLLIRSEYLSAAEAAAAGLRKVSLEELLATSDIILLQTSLTARTRHMLNDGNLGLIKSGALLVNIGRGELIDEQALARHLATGRFRAALDVYAQEPLDPASPLRQLPNVVCFPHLGAATEYCRQEMGRDTIRNLEDFLAGRVPAGRIEEAEALAMSEH